jgi:hypothetical protein
MVAAVAKNGALEGTRNTLVNFSKFVVSGTDAPYKALAFGSGACSIAAIIATFAANNDLDPDSEPSAFTKFFSPLFSKATTGSFAGQFLQALFGFASPSSALAYGALAALNNDFNGRPREVGIQIAAQIRTLKEKLKVLELQLKSTSQKEEQVKIQASINSCKTSIESLLDKLKEAKAGISLGTNLTLAFMGATFMRSMSVMSPQAQLDPSKPFPNFAHEIVNDKTNPRSLRLSDWWKLFVSNGKKEIKSIFDLPKSFNPQNWTGTFFGKNKKLTKSLEDGYYIVKPYAPVNPIEKKISLLNKDGKLDNLKTLMMTFGSSKAPYFFHGITSFSRLAGLGLISCVLLTKGYDFVKSRFNNEKKSEDKNSLDDSCINSSTFLIKNIAVPVSGIANMLSGASPLNMAVYGPFSTACTFWGGSAYMASAFLPSISSMLQITGTMGLLIGNCAAVLKVPAAKFLKAEELDSFSSSRQGLTSNNIVNLQRNKTLVHQ